MKFRKRPLEIEAMQFDGGATSATEIQVWSGQTARMMIDPEAEMQGCVKMVIDTSEGKMTASAGDWIIRGVAGEYYPCKPDIFAKSYEPVTVSQSCYGEKIREIRKYIARLVPSDEGSLQIIEDMKALLGFDWDRSEPKHPPPGWWKDRPPYKLGDRFRVISLDYSGPKANHEGSKPRAGDIMEVSIINQNAVRWANLRTGEESIWIHPLDLEAIPSAEVNQHG